MQAQRALLNFTESEKKLGDRLLGIAMEIDRIEGYSEPHAIVMAVMAEKLAVQMGLHGSDLTALKYAALAHDLGERAMKRNYLLRPDAITWEETLDLWRHPILGEQAAAEIGLPRHSQLLIRWHHEWWNGLGYPDSLAGDSIPIGARILRLVDTWFALRSNRPHRPAFDEDEAIQMITDRAGLEMDPNLVRIFLIMHQEERNVRRREPEAIIPGADTFTVLTPEGLQTAVVPHEAADEPSETIQQMAEKVKEILEPEFDIAVRQPAETAQLVESDSQTQNLPEASGENEQVSQSFEAEPVPETGETLPEQPAPDRNEG